MADTFSQCFFHLVFSPNISKSLIDKSWSNNLEIFITSIVQENGHKMIAIKCMSDHIHIFFGYNLNQKIPDLVNIIKTTSTKWLKEQNICKTSFNWQNGYGAFTHTKSTVNVVYKYIMNQENHHKKVSFKEEYLSFLKRNDIEYRDEYLFEFLDPEV